MKNREGLRDRTVMITYTDGYVSDILVEAKFFKTDKAINKQIDSFISALGDLSTYNYLIKVESYFPKDDSNTISYISKRNIAQVIVTPKKTEEELKAETEEILAKIEQAKDRFVREPITGKEAVVVPIDDEVKETPKKKTTKKKKGKE